MRTIRPFGCLFKNSAMHISAISQPAQSSDADTIAIPIFDEQGRPPETPVEVGELLASGEARSSLKALAVTHAAGKRWLTVGLGARGELTAERARVAAAAAGARAREISTQALCWQLPSGSDPRVRLAVPELVRAIVPSR